MQPCGLRDLACPRGRLSFGLKAGRVAECVRGTLAQRALKKHSCSPVGCGIWRALGGDGRLASKPGELRTASAAPWPKGVQKTIMQPCGLRDLAYPWGRQLFGLKAGQVAECIRRTLAERGLKNIPATLRAAGFGTPLGATFVWPQGRAGCGLRPQNLGRKGAKNDHATLRAARFGASLGATVVWPQNQAICGLRPRHLGPKGSKKHSCNPVGCGIWHVLEGYGRLVSRPDKLRAAPATAKPKEAHSEADR